MLLKSFKRSKQQPTIGIATAIPMPGGGSLIETIYRMKHLASYELELCRISLKVWAKAKVNKSALLDAHFPYTKGT